MSILDKFKRSNAGSVSIIFALAILALLAVVGVALDYAVAVKRKQRLDGALDAALLAATNAASDAERAGRTDWNDIAAAVAHTAMQANLSPDEAKALVTMNAHFVKSGYSIVGTADYDAESPTTFMSIFQINNVELSSAATAQVNPGNYIDLHFVIDNSASMGIGADAASQAIMYAAYGPRADGKIGPVNCALACHHPTTDYSLTPAAANALGAKLRIDIARESVIQSIQNIQAKGYAADRVRVSLYTFSHGLKTVLNPTTDLNAAAAAANAITLDDSNGGGGTYIWKSIGDLSTAIGKGGKGTSGSDRLSFVIILTDGVENSSRMDLKAGSSPATYVWSNPTDSSDWKSTGSPPEWMQAPDPTRCDILKTTTGSSSGNHTVLTIEVKYFINDQIKAAKVTETSIINQITPDIRSSLTACASDPSYAVLASDSSDIKAAFDKVMSLIFTAEVVRLSQ